MQYGILGTACALVIGVYVYAAHSSAFASLSPNAADAYYNLLVQGFRAGQLSLKKEVPPGLAQLADLYDSTANAHYRSGSYKILDLSYYKGRLYLYFGVTPALLLFWPFTALTGHYLFHGQAVAIFCAMGFLANVGLLCALWRRYFAEVSVWVVAACTLVLGLATGMPVLLSRSDVCEVPISCGYMLTMLALWAIWCALHDTRRRHQWLAAASVAYGLALGARPSLLFGAVILLVPVAQAWRERRPIGTLLTAALGPIMLIGLGLMLYNALRFDNPLEFGQRYQLNPDRQDSIQHFSLRYLWFNFRIYFLEPARWSSRFPFVHDIAAPPLPAGRAEAEHSFGVLTTIPLIWLALAAPLAWSNWSAESRSALRWFVTAVALFFGICALTLGLYYYLAVRFEVEFLPALVLLAVVGILSLERALAPTSKSGLADRPVWRHTVRWGWGLLLGFSVAFNLFAGVRQHAGVHNGLGNTLLRSGKVTEAMQHYEQALRLNPDYPEAHYNLGFALAQAGKVQEAIEHYEQALRIKPDYADVHNSLGIALAHAGRMQEAIGHWEQALRFKPDLAEAHYNLGFALELEGKLKDAIGHYKQVLRIKPNDAMARSGLARLQAVQ
ncbi:MAG: tetratricopeptide repeat protein [Verrucomicrobiia bacterium]